MFIGLTMANMVYITGIPKYQYEISKPAWIDAITNRIQSTVKVNFSGKSLKNHLFEIFWIIPKRQSLYATTELYEV